MSHSKAAVTVADDAEATKSSSQRRPIAATEIPPQPQATTYPSAFRSMVQGRTKQRLGEHFQLTNFGVNRTTLNPGASSSLQHCHATQDEFIYILQGSPTLRFGNEDIQMQAGECMGFPKNREIAHSLVNETSETAVYLEVGDRTPGDVVNYPHVDLTAIMNQDTGKYEYKHKNGTPYEEFDA
ncbi:hypothetical protein MPSEU_000770500 [Mayamaea pseudoterrestris]|nr:hypothetical protein MPSEU_000770500 [Mayamaea pseudoterrestris]